MAVSAREHGGDVGVVGVAGGLDLHHHHLGRLATGVDAPGAGQERGDRGPVEGVGLADQPVAAGEHHVRVGDQHGAGEQLPAQGAGQPGGQIAPVGRGRQHHHPPVDEQRGEGGRPGAGSEGPQLDAADVVGAAEVGARRRGLVAGQEGVAAGLGDGLVAAEGQGPVADGDHRDHGVHNVRPTRSPSMTAAWARRGATQSPTRWTSRSPSSTNRSSTGRGGETVTTQS